MKKTTDKLTKGEANYFNIENYLKSFKNQEEIKDELNYINNRLENKYSSPNDLATKVLKSKKEDLEKLAKGE